MFLSRIEIKNYKGIKSLNVEFSPDINIIIGENGKNKTALIDAIRLLYNIGEPERDIYVSNEDFFVDEESGTSEKKIEISYIFKGLSEEQKGAFYEFIVFSEEPEETYAKVVISYEFRENSHPLFNYSTGIGDSQKADYNTFELFQHYYLGALRDSTKDLLSTRNNILGSVILQAVSASKTEDNYTEIMQEANESLLEQPEVESTKENINDKLLEINKFFEDKKIGLRITPTNISYILNSIKPFLPYKNSTLPNDGFHLYQNSLGFNNMIYIATVLSDINEKIREDNLTHYSLLIEEPEAHLHPQLQLNLYNFLKKTTNQDNSQLFITSHSPTLTSKVKFENLILLDNRSFKIDDCFLNREEENIIENTTDNVELKDTDFVKKKKQLERYIDVTKSQLFFAKGILLIEGISEEILIPTFCNLKNYTLDDYQIELVNVHGTSFYPFIHLFNSSKRSKRIPKKVSILTDGDEYPKSKEKRFSFANLIEDEYERLDELYDKITKAEYCSRVKNLNSVINERKNILVEVAQKTFEFEFVLCNVNKDKRKFKKNFLVQYIETISKKKVESIEEYIEYLDISSNNFSEEQKYKIALLLWKTLPKKAEFAQDFAMHILDNLDSAKQTLKVPDYINTALKHFTE